MKVRAISPPRLADSLECGPPMANAQMPPVWDNTLGSRWHLQGEDSHIYGRDKG